MRDAVERGPDSVAGGQEIGELGNFCAPKALANIPLDANVFSDEPFGPNAAIRPFIDMNEAISEANRLWFALAV